jgi:hypothetical protein
VLRRYVGVAFEQHLGTLHFRGRTLEFPDHFAQAFTLVLGQPHNILLWNGHPP